MVAGRTVRRRERGERAVCEKARVCDRHSPEVCDQSRRIAGGIAARAAPAGPRNKRRGARGRRRRTDVARSILRPGIVSELRLSDGPLFVLRVRTGRQDGPHQGAATTKQGQSAERVRPRTVTRHQQENLSGRRHLPRGRKSRCSRRCAVRRATRYIRVLRGLRIRAHVGPHGSRRTVSGVRDSAATARASRSAGIFARKWAPRRGEGPRTGGQLRDDGAVSIARNPRPVSMENWRGSLSAARV